MSNAKWLVMAMLLVAAVPARAQQPQQQPIGPFIVDLRGIFARHKQEPSVATDLGVTPANLPTRSFGLAAGVHFYPARSKRVTLGVGGHVLVARSSHALDATPGQPPSPIVERHFRALAPELSLNFGHRNGWSYISGGIGRAKLYVDRQDAPDTSPQGRGLFHYGAGARWFTHHPVAVSLEVRWYSVAPQLASATGVAQPRTTLMVLSGGIAFR